FRVRRPRPGRGRPRAGACAPLCTQHPAGLSERPAHGAAPHRLLRGHRRAAPGDEGRPGERPEHRDWRRRALRRGAQAVRGGRDLRGHPVLQLRRARPPGHAAGHGALRPRGDAALRRADGARRGPAMKFGLNFFPSFRPSDYSTAEYFAERRRVADRADKLGFTSVKRVEHYFFDYGGHSPNPIVFLSAVAARTTRIRPITGAVIPAFNHPVKLAAELALLDNLSNGRLDVGFGRAFIPREFEVFGVSMDESRARFEEGIDIVTRLWTEDRVSYEGKFHQFRDVHLKQRPVQKPHPPIWVASVASVESFVWAGRRGYNVMVVPYAGSMARVRDMVVAYREAWREAGHPPGAEQVQSSLHCYIAETHRESVEGARPRVERDIEGSGAAGPARAMTSSSSSGTIGKCSGNSSPRSRSTSAGSATRRRRGRSSSSPAASCRSSRGERSNVSHNLGRCAWILTAATLAALPIGACASKKAPPPAPLSVTEANSGDSVA